MKFLPLVLLAALTMSFTPWNTHLESAKNEASKEHKFILLNFSGSDWCGPCIKLHKTFFDSEVFTHFADSSLVLVNADFPRQKKNQLEKSQQKENDQLAELYNRNGAFPFTVLLNQEGKVVHAWDGLPKETPEEFVQEIKKSMDASK